ncbi:MAG: tyrosine-type recombinase/integrase [Saccharospirillaceae bacterium]|nr:tyrosine-type recombinase/integrase [Pseudomonadales bacterium]NRB81134.1 tyrosine-type recombinase/integrase [Saccharospirillaceae bacterium]
MNKQITSLLDQLISTQTLKAIPKATNSLLAATNDMDAYKVYLSARCQKQTTFRNMERDMRKLLVFMKLNDFTKFDEISLEFAQAFKNWLANPGEEFILSRGKKSQAFEIDSKLNPNWLPFRKPLSAQAIERTISNLKALWSWLIDTEYLNRNPWRPLKVDSQAGQSNLSARHIPNHAIELIKRFLETYRPDSKQKTLRLAQQRWLFYLLLFTGSRISAVLNANIDDIQTKNGKTYLKLSVKGSGEKTHFVPWIPQANHELLRYRESLSLIEGANVLLVDRIKNRSEQFVSRNLYWRQIKDLFSDTKHFYENEVGQDAELKEVFDQISPHWIRHFVASNLGEHAKELLGHSTKRQTQAYQHKEYESLAQAIAKL